MTGLFLWSFMITRNEILEILREDPSMYENSIGEWFYEGPISKEASNNLALKAYRIWCTQGDRCNNSNDKAYKNYGAKGVKRIWNSRFFINWYINQLLKRDQWNKPSVSRNKDLGDYDYLNCELIELGENVQLMYENKKENYNKKIIDFINKNSNKISASFKNELIEFLLKI